MLPCRDEFLLLERNNNNGHSAVAAENQPEDEHLLLSDSVTKQRLTFKSPILYKKGSDTNEAMCTNTSLLSMATIPSSSPNKVNTKSRQRCLIRQETAPVATSKSSNSRSTQQASSESSSCSSSNQRRCIFGSFWEASAQQDRGAHSKRTLSNSSFTVLPLPPPPSQPSPSFYLSSSEDCGNSNSSSIWGDQYPWQNKQLPPLPTPLQRLRRHSGVYPLNTPQSILKRRSSSSLSGENKPVFHGTTPLDLTRALDESLFLADATSSQTTTTTTTALDVLVAASAETNHDSRSCDSASTTVTTTDTDSPNSSCHSCNTLLSQSQHQPNKMVHFDPRVTVTELAEWEEHRAWYTDVELERFKNDTVQIAKVYLSEHPEQIRAYSQAFLDPVTQKYRKKALFSMPALCDLTLDSCISSSNHGMECTRTMSPEQQPDDKVIRRILIVDKSEWILDLFRRSMLTMFSTAEIHCVQSAQLALRQLQCRSYDLVIAEDQLLPSIPVTNNVQDSENAATTLTNLFACIDSNAKRDMLLIGVVSGSTSPQQQQHRKLAGADLVWTKPPPRMDSALGNELTRTLSDKRQQQNRHKK